MIRNARVRVYSLEVGGKHGEDSHRAPHQYQGQFPLRRCELYFCVT